MDMKLLEVDKERLTVQMSREDFRVVFSIMEYAYSQYHSLDPVLFDDYSQERLEEVGDKLEGILSEIIKQRRNAQQ